MERPLPAWFDDAKLGIFVHWTAAAVPAFAPVTDSPFDLAAEGGWEEAMRCSPYVEWYQNSIAIEGSPAARSTTPRCTATAPTTTSSSTFLDGHAGWQADPWADLFAAAGARYVVLVTKHHDGVLLWPSATPNPHKPRWASERDLVGDLAAAVRARDLRFGTYYSGGLDWTFGGLPMRDFQAMLGAIPQTRRVPRLRRRPLARAHRALPARRALERHRLPGRGRPAGAVRALLRGGARRRGQQPLRLDGPDRRHGALRLRHARVLDQGRARPASGRAPAASAPASATTARRTSRPTCRPTRWCGCSSTSSPTAATCSSTSAPTPTAPSRGCRPSGCSRSAGGSAPTATPSTAPARGPAPTAPPPRATTSATRPATARCSPSSAARRPATSWSSTSRRRPSATVHLLGHDAAAALGAHRRRVPR